MPAAEPVLAPWRERHTTAGRLGMPAHVTLLPIFDAGSGTLAGIVDVLRAAAASQPAFTTRLDQVERWGDDDLLVLRPDDDAPFHALRDAVAGAVPDLPPREHPFRPHVTAAMTRHGADLDEVEAAVRAHPAPVADVTEAWLMERDDAPGARWQLVERLPLAAGSAHGSP